MRECVIRVLENKLNTQLIKDEFNIEEDESDNEFKEDQSINQLSDFDGMFTISDISNALGMYKEEKTMSRVLAELKKTHAQIESSAVRNGRVFQYKYFLKNKRKSKLIEKEF